EDGIRDFHVTGVQTCALPIFRFQLRSTLDAVRPAAGNALEAPPAIRQKSLDALFRPHRRAGQVAWLRIGNQMSSPHLTGLSELRKNLGEHQMRSSGHANELCVL